MDRAREAATHENERQAIEGQHNRTRRGVRLRMVKLNDELLDPDNWMDDHGDGIASNHKLYRSDTVALGSLNLLRLHPP